jgi:Domain of unknown function (DUF3846)
MEKVIVITGRKNEVLELDKIDDLKTMQSLVGGFIQTLQMDQYIEIENVILIMNEEGKLQNLPKTFFGDYVFEGPVIVAMAGGEIIKGFSDEMISEILSYINPS